MVQDFLRASPIGYALIQPESISTKAVIQIWSTAEIGEGFIKFSHAEKEYSITPDVVREALHLPTVTSFAPIIFLMMKSRILSNHYGIMVIPQN